MLKATGTGLFALVGGLLLPQKGMGKQFQKEDKLLASDIRYFRDQHETEFAVPYQVNVGETFSIRLKTGTYPKQKINKLHFLSDWGTRSQFFPANHQGKDMKVEVVEHPEPYNFKYATPGGSHQQQPHKWIMKHPQNGANVNLKGDNTLQVRIGRKGRVLLVLYYDTFLAAHERTYPIYFIINAS